jgi:LmbE family N-acetylglucosaminyl deacetylase
MDDFGSPEDIITTTVDVSGYVDRKRAAMQAHASQIPPDSFFLSLPPDAFRAAFGVEWFIRRDKPDIRETWLFDDL